MFFESSIAKSPKELSELAKGAGMKPISYSQFSLFSTCPFAWKSKYVDNIKDDSYSIHLLFGSAMHTVIQEYITLFYKKGGAIADEMNFDNRLLTEMAQEFEKAKEGLPENLQDFTTQTEMIEFYRQGLEILYTLRKNRGDYFTKKDWELVGIETPILINTDSNPGVAFIGFIDIILKDVKRRRYKIIDLKTSTRGWGAKDKASLLKSAQLILYKKYYAKQFGIDPNSIDIEFLILRRMIFEGSEFPMKRLQRHCPASGKPTINKVERMLVEFVNTFDDKGNVKPDATFPKTVGDGCKYCFYGAYNICDKNKPKK